MSRLPQALRKHSHTSPQGEHARGKVADGGGHDTAIKILHRHHFVSKLQRMSVLATVSGQVRQSAVAASLWSGSSLFSRIVRANQRGSFGCASPSLFGSSYARDLRPYVCSLLRQHEKGEQPYVLAKGSPEVIKTLLTKQETVSAPPFCTFL